MIYVYSHIPIRVVPFLHLRIINTHCYLQSIQSNTILQSVHRFSTGLSSSGYKYRNYARTSAIQHLNIHNCKLQTTIQFHTILDHTYPRNTTNQTLSMYRQPLGKYVAITTAHLILVNISFSNSFSALWLTVNSVTSEAVMQTTTSFSQLSEALHLLSERLSYSYCVMHFVIFLRKRQRDGSQSHNQYPLQP